MLANMFYVVALIAASPWILYRCVRHGRYRRGCREKFLGLSQAHASRLRRGESRCIWIHAVSVGEVNLLPGLLEAWSQEEPGLRMLVSTSTDTGYDLAVRHFGSDSVFFCPLDFSWAVKRTLRNLQPEKLILTELELWPNLIKLAARTGCPVSVINARLSGKSARGYQRLSWFTRSAFQNLDWVACQDDEAANHFRDCGARDARVFVTGSLKFDGAPSSRDTPEVQACARWAGVDPWHRVWLVGSTQIEEEQLSLEIYQRLQAQYPELRLIIVPRHPERFDAVAVSIERLGLTVHRRTEATSLESGNWDSDRVILVDTVGELRHWWGVCEIATVGGSFGDRGGQNMLEPAGYGCAVSFGPNTRNFRHIADRLIAAGGAVRVRDDRELEEFVTRCLDDQPAAEDLGRAAKGVVQQHRGATRRTIQYLMLTAEKTGNENRPPRQEAA